MKNIYEDWREIPNISELDHLYIIADYRGGDIFTTYALDPEDAAHEAEYQWDHLTTRERKDRSICSAIIYRSSLGDQDPDDVEEYGADWGAWEGLEQYDGCFDRGVFDGGKPHFFVRFHTGAGDFEIVGDLETAKAAADENAAYTQMPITIEDETGEEFAMRPWWGVEYDQNETEDAENEVITFGRFGYYGAWE